MQPATLVGCLSFTRKNEIAARLGASAGLSEKLPDKCKRPSVRETGGLSISAMRTVNPRYIFPTIALAKPDELTFVAPSIWRCRS